MFKARFIALASIALISLIAVGWIADRSARLMARAVAALDDTRDTLLAVDSVRAALMAAESDARGYTITRSPVLLRDFQRDVPKLRQAFLRLETLAREPRQRPVARRLDQLLARRVASLQGLFSAAPDEAFASVMNGTAISREATAALDEIASEEMRQFDAQALEAAKAQRFAIYGPWLMALVAAVLFTAMIVQFTLTLRAEDAARERAQEADRMKDQFLATVSHELRTPLTAIIGWCGLLQRDESRPSLLDEGLRNIYDCARVQSQLIEDLLDVSRIVAGKVMLNVAEVNVADVVERAIASVSVAAKEKNITIHRSFDEQPRLCRGDRARLQQIVWNLLSNAIKFTPDGGEVEVATLCSDSEIAITVRDNGIGIAPDLLPHIFDRFRQGEAAAAHQTGLGLGLSIVKSLAHLHGGCVTAESDGPGKGALFTVRLPLAEPLLSSAA